MKDGGDNGNQFLVRELSLLPGLSRSALQLITYAQGCMHGVSAILESSRSIAQQAAQRDNTATNLPATTSSESDQQRHTRSHSNNQFKGHPTSGAVAPSGGVWNNSIPPALKLPPTDNQRNRRRRD